QRRPGSTCPRGGAAPRVRVGRRTALRVGFHHAGDPCPAPRTEALAQEVPGALLLLRVRRRECLVPVVLTPRHFAVGELLLVRVCVDLVGIDPDEEVAADEARLDSHRQQGNGLVGRELGNRLGRVAFRTCQRYPECGERRARGGHAAG